LVYDAGHIARMRGARIACKIVIGKPKRERPFGRPMRRCEDNIIIYDELLHTEQNKNHKDIL